MKHILGMNMMNIHNSSFGVNRSSQMNPNDEKGKLMQHTKPCLFHFKEGDVGVQEAIFVPSP